MSVSTSALAPLPSLCPFRIAGIGASAGGLDSLEQLVGALPADPGLAFVVIQHLSPDFRSMMGELLARHSSMPIHMAEHEMLVEPNHVYLLPPKKEMIIRNRRLLLSEKERAHTLPMPIDQFLRSLANDCGSAAIGVILSGSGTDGAHGVRDIADAGGLVFAETPESASFDGMPVSACATGCVAKTGTPAELAALLLAARDVPVAAPADREVEHAAATPLDEILRLLRDQFGLDFSQYKASTVTRRVLRRVDIGDIAGPEAYLARLRQDPAELGRLYHDLLIGVTRFFRDPQAFEILERQVVPDLIATIPPDQEIRAWVAGCATGEEVYSMAMLFLEQLSRLQRPANLKILATDVHHASLAHASAGVYDEEQLEHVSAERRGRFFTMRGQKYLVHPDVRQHVVFAPHNVTRDAPFTNMHLISCRNLLIYLEPRAQKLVLSLLHFGLTTGGALFLGSSETPGDLLPEFTPVSEHWRLYRKRRDVRLVGIDRLTARTAPLSPIRATRPTPQDAPPIGIYDQLLDRWMPPAFLVDDQGRLVDSFRGAERYLTMRARRPSMLVVDLLRNELRSVVAGAIHRALGRGEPVRYPSIASDSGRVTICAEPLHDSRTPSRYVLVTIESEEQVGITAAPSPAPDALPVVDVSPEQVEVLEADLSRTRERLQSTVEELQTSNEELQSANEELIASNEELQSTNEELHSVNEELYTVNAEHQRKIVELRLLNSDMQHLLEAADVGMLFLDRDLRVRRYTPRIAPLFHLESGDIGRSIQHFSHELVRPSFLEEIKRALVEGQPLEQEVRSTAGTPFLLRIAPYRPIRSNGDDAVDHGTPGEGVVISLTDVTTLVRTQERARYLSLIVEGSEDAIVGVTLDGTITSWNRGATRLYGHGPDDMIGRNIRVLAPARQAAAVDQLLRTVAGGDALQDLEVFVCRKDGRQLDVSVSLSPVRDRDGRVVGAAAIARDIAPLRGTQRELASREARIRLLLESTAEAIYGVDMDGICVFCNPACARLLGYQDVTPLIGHPIDEVVFHRRAGTTTLEHPARRVLRAGEGRHAPEDELVRADGTTFPAESWSHPIRDGQAIVGAVVTFIDVTARRKAEHEIRDAARRREQFLAMLSHELRNPLAAILGATQVLRRAECDANAIMHAGDVIARQSSHMARLLDDLLDVARITRGGIELRKTDLDLRSVIAPALEAAGPVLTGRRIRLATDIADEPLPVRGDAARLQQVVANLLSNAARYSDIGGAVHLNVARGPDGIELRVRDAGRGIEPDMLNAIFGLFVQGQQDLDRDAGGLGVGLTLVRQIVEHHGGTVQARSDGRGRGSEFVVRLPYLRHALLTDGSGPHATGQPGARRIVLAEDQDDMREMLRILLTGHGHSVFEAPDGPTAVDTIESVHPDVALLDIGLPGVNGFDVARAVRRNPSLSDVMLIAVTGYGTADDVARTREAGFDAHLTKPVDVERLADMVRSPRSARPPLDARLPMTR